MTIHRRSLLAGAGAAGTAALLASCTTSGPASPEENLVDPSLLPDLIPYEGVTPDLPGDVLVHPGFFSYPDDPIRFTEEVPGDGAPITALVPTSFAVPPPVSSNSYWQEFNQRIGSDMEIAITTQKDWVAKFNTTVAGNALPDMFNVPTQPSMPQFMEATTADLTEYLSGDAIAKYPALANLPTASWSQCIFNNKIHAIPITRGTMGLSVIFGRTDLMAEAGITEPPQNFAEFAAQAKELTGGNRWGLGSPMLGQIRRMLHIPSYWILEDDQVKLTLDDERQLQALEAARSLVEAGVVHPDAAGTATPTKKQWFGSGTTILHDDSFIAWFSLYVQFTSVEGIQIDAQHVPGFDGGRGRNVLPNANQSISAINKNSADRIETFLKVANWLAAPFGTEEYLFQKFGVEGVHHTRDENGDPEVIAGTADMVQLGSLYLADAARVLYSPGRQQAVEAAHAYQSEWTEDAFVDPTYALFSDTDSRKGAELNRLLSTATEDIMYGREDVSAWTDAVAEWKSSGGDDIFDEYQKALDASR